LKIDFDHLMPSEDRSVRVTICRECAQVHDMLYVVTSGRIDQDLLCTSISTYSQLLEKSGDAFQRFIESSWIIEIIKRDAPN